MEAAAVGLASFYVGHVLGDLVWYSGVSGLVSRGRRYLNTRVLSAVLTGCAAFLVALAIAFLVGAVRTFA